MLKTILRTSVITIVVLASLAGLGIATVIGLFYCGFFGTCGPTHASIPSAIPVCATSL